MKNLITEARELCAAATPGPWESELQYVKTSDKSIANGMLAACIFIKDAAFTARARTLVPELCDALEKCRWIPVTERLPKTEKPVQVYMPKLHMSVQTGFYTKYYGEDDGEWYEHWVASGDVTHWMPLPAPPEEGE